LSGDPAKVNYIQLESLSGQLETPSIMSDSSFEDAEKGIRHSKDTGSPHLTQQQEDLLEAAEPPFTFHGHDDEEHNTAELRKVGTGTSMHRVPSSKPSVNNIRSVPNGGTKAWLQVLASFFLFFNSWGIVNTFGMFRHEPSEAIQFC
jgi:hypothetical protein